MGKQIMAEKKAGGGTDNFERDEEKKMSKAHLDGNWREVKDFDWFLHFCRWADWFWWRIFFPALIWMAAGYALAWFQYVGRYSGGN